MGIVRGLHRPKERSSILKRSPISVPVVEHVRPSPNPEQLWLNARKQLRRSERLPHHFEELYRAVLSDIDEGRSQRRNSVLHSFELLWSPALDQLAAGSEDRASALNDLIDTHILYRCLRSSLDRAPQLMAVRRDMDLIRKHLRNAFEKLSSLSSFKELELAEQRFRKYSRGTTSRDVQRVDDAMLSRIFEIRARAVLRDSLSEMDELLGSVWGRSVGVQRGQPRKYSKDFLILRSARLFERYVVGSHAKIRAFPNHSNLNPREFDRGPFYAFLITAFSIVEPTFQQAAFGLEKSIKTLLRVRKHSPDADLLVRRTSTPDDLAAFVRLSESKGNRSRV